MAKIEVTGGMYPGREGLVVRIIDGNIVISGWYDGGCSLDVKIVMPIEEFLERLSTPEPGERVKRKETK